LNVLFRGKEYLRRIAEVARALARGGEAPEFTADAEPYRSILSDIRSLASRLQERSQSGAEERNRLLAILESMTEGVLVVGIEQKILLVNSALARAFGFDKNAAQGRFFWEMFRDPDINEMIQEALKKRSGLRREHEALLSEKIFEIQTSPVNAGEDLIGVVAVFRDITSLKQFDRLRSEFVANVSHELKTPLTSILGFVETLKDGGVDDADRVKFLDIIEEQSKKLYAMIEDLLLLSRLESTREPLKLETVPLYPLFEKMRQMFTPLLKEDHLSFTAECEPRDLVVTVEPSSFNRALSNLVDNALKYNRREGAVSIKASRTLHGVEIAVSDTGIGIAASDLARIFERFYRADKSRSRETGGSGLGLSISKHIVERHGGRIEVESALGQGSKFSIILPKSGPFSS
jgi:two-component system, OmpR family, phosphate regulon sensor histidine kinase PhoR